MTRVGTFLVLAFGMSGLARADLMLALNSGPVPNGANFNWVYTVTLKSGSTLNTGDFFTIYDIGGFEVGVPIAGNVIKPASNWSSSIQVKGSDGFAQAPADSNAIYNVTYTFTGSAIIAATDTVLGGGAGAFGYTSATPYSSARPFSATTHISAGGAAAGNSSTITVAGDIIFRDGFNL